MMLIGIKGEVTEEELKALERLGLKIRGTLFVSPPPTPPPEGYTLIEVENDEKEVKEKLSSLKEVLFIRREE